MDYAECVDSLQAWCDLARGVACGHLAYEESNAPFFDSLTSILRLVVEAVDGGFGEGV